MNIIPGSPWVIDTRRVSLRVHSQPVLRTPSGNDPINPTGLEIEYCIRTGKPGAVTVIGDRLTIGLLRRRNTTVKRRITVLAEAPKWVREIVDAYQPVVPEVLDWLDGIDPADGNEKYARASRLRMGLRGLI